MHKKICNISLCKSNSMELGRLLSELQTRTIRMPLHGIDVEELNELKDTTNSFFDTCKITDHDKNTVRGIYSDIWIIQKTSNAEKIGEQLIKMSDKLYHSVSDCDEV